MWIKAHGDGALFTSEVVKPYCYYAKGLRFMINNKMLSLTLGQTGDTAYTSYVVNYYSWAHVAVTADATAASDSTAVKFYVNKTPVYSDTLDGYVVDYPDEYNSHKVGAAHGGHFIKNCYKGYIYSFTVLNYAETNFSNKVRAPCLGCDVCPEETG
jgi:hypothetical protein